MVDVAVSIIGCDKNELLDDFRDVHRKYSDSEQPFALLETRTVLKYFPNMPRKEVIKLLDPAFHAFNSSRKANLKLHRNVRETLETLKMSGVRLVAHTESKLLSVIDRLRRLDLHQYFDAIYCRERSFYIDNESFAREGYFKDFPMEKVVQLSEHQSKPNVLVLREICTRQKTPLNKVAYIGDSVARDILMAKRAGVFSIWAAYGAHHDPDMYDKLVRISHWTVDEVDKEKHLRSEAKVIRPDFVAEQEFSEVLIALGLVTEANFPMEIL